MSDYIQSKFKIDYRNFETLPHQHVENLYAINSRIRQVEHIEKLKREIEELQLSMAAEMNMVANDVLRENVFPRFGGYSDFISTGDFITQEALNERPTFGNFANAVEMLGIESKRTEFKDADKICETFSFLLENFIWIFFEGCGLWMVDDMKQIVVDYDHRSYLHGSDEYPSEVNYFFNAANASNGKTYQIEFTFFDLNYAINAQYMKRKFSESYGSDMLARPFEAIRSANYGQIFCTISRLEKSKRGGESSEPKKKIYIKSFDPLEISAFVKHVVFENKGEINE